MRYPSIALLIFALLISTTASAQLADFDIAGSRFCGLLEDGKVQCTRLSNADSPSLQPDPELTFTQVQGGNYYVCGITTNGTVECWGDEPNEGQTSPPSFDSTVVSLSVGAYHACAMDDEGNVKCWGQNVHGQTEPPESATSLIDLHVFGIYATCGVNNTEELVCWGETQASFVQPAPLLSMFESIPMTQVRFSNDIGCIIRSDTTAACYQSSLGQTAFAEFNNGPYKTVFPLNAYNETRSTYAACALTFNNELDCVETITTQNNTLASFPLSTTRLSDTYKVVHANGRELVGLDFNNKLIPINSTTPAPNTRIELRIANGEIDMPTLSITDAQFYGSSAGIELFFNSPDTNPGSYILAYDTEVFRDGELLTVTDNFGSYLDSTATEENEYTYEIRAVHPYGQTGAFSEPVTVSTQPVDPGTNPPPTSSRPNKPTGLRAEVYYHDVELFWDRNNSGAVRNYEIRKDGELVATTRGTSWYDNTTEGGESYQFDVVAVGQDNEILGIESVQAQIGPAVCN